MTEITPITKQQDQQDRDTLLEALGTENNPTQWLLFMDAVLSVLAVVLKRGRSSKNDVEASLIGRLGFTSWRQMVETPVTDGGLGWNWSGWVAWRRAYKIVQEHQYLRGLDLTANAVVVLDQEAKKDDVEFPQDAEAFSRWRDSRQQDKSQQQARTISELKKQVSVLEAECEELSSELDRRSLEIDRYIALSRWQLFKAFLKGRLD